MPERICYVRRLDAVCRHREIRADIQHGYLRREEVVAVVALDRQLVRVHCQHYCQNAVLLDHRSDEAHRLVRVSEHYAAQCACDHDRCYSGTGDIESELGRRKGWSRLEVVYVAPH